MIVDIQNETTLEIPFKKAMREWVQTTLKSVESNVELCLRIVDEPEMSDLNLTYRNKQGPTNVLSFPAGFHEALPDKSIPENQHLGDIIICGPILEIEAKDQNKALEAHFAHIVIHGCLHLIGYDHQNNQEANIMESLEIKLMKQLGFENPYGETINYA